MSNLKELEAKILRFRRILEADDNIPLYIINSFDEYFNIVKNRCGIVEDSPEMQAYYEKYGIDRNRQTKLDL